jgi:hypothetical protein
MNTNFFRMLFSYKITWFVAGIIALSNIFLFLWFTPPLIIMLLLFGIDFISFIIWGVLTANSDYFITHTSGIFSRIDLNNLNSILKQAFPDFRTKALQCIKLIGTISKEFKKKMKLEELDYLVDNLYLLADNNKNLYQRYLQFGTREQKAVMLSKIDEHVKSMNSTYEMLLAFSGNLSLLEANNNEVSDASTKLKYINQTLSDLVKGTENEQV